jgi:sugar phosphate isomerase/epimerase
MIDERRLCIHQVCVLEQWSTPQFIDALVRHRVPATALWRDKLREAGVAETARRLADSALAVTSLCAAGFLSMADRAAAARAEDDVRRALDEARAIGAATLMFITGGVDPADKDLAGARARSLERLAKLGPHARATGVKLAIEPLHPMACATRSVVSSLAIANDWCDALGDDAAFGIAIDTYAVWWDPDLPREIARAGRRICNFHISDWLAETRDLRLDRGMIGDGLIDIAAIRRMVESAGYSGYLEVEIFSAGDWWKRNGDDVIRAIKERCRTGV